MDTRKIGFGLLVLVFLFSRPLFAENLLDYGFEDWGGSVAATPNYIFTTDYLVEHAAATEVVASYGSWTPHSGDFFFLGNGSPTVDLNPGVTGISAGYGGMNPHNNIGRNIGDSGNDLNIEEDISTREIFIRVWARFNEGFYGNFNSNPTPGVKWIRVHNNDPNNKADIFWSISCDRQSPIGYIWQTSSGGDHGHAILTNAYDGNWHKFSMYVNFDQGIVRQWYDTDNETAENATVTWNNGGQIGAASKPTYVSIKGNYASKLPLDEIYYALDDIEIWDGMPDGSSTQDRPNAPTHLIVDSLTF